METAGTLSYPGLLIFCATALIALSGVPALFLNNPDRDGQSIAAGFQIVAALIGIPSSIVLLVSRRVESVTLALDLPIGAVQAGIDPLSALFLLLIFTVSACCSLYATGYWRSTHPATTRRLIFFAGLTGAAMALLVTARNGITFLIFWEIMALSAYFALAVEDEKQSVREAGTLYLITTHVGTLSLLATFALLKGTSSSYSFPATASLSGMITPASGIFIAALFGFGMKAGIMPLHLWLPSAHANAPSHISALMSGVLIKMGIYGMIRMLSFFYAIPLWWGIVLLTCGALSGIMGVAFAIGQHDLKRLLAYHSIENIGIIILGMGTALIGLSINNQTLVLLGMAGALLHVLNHGIFKSLLFLGAGAVIRATETREIDLMGGLARKLPWTTIFFLTGAVAICGLPPLNGFVSEYLIYLGLFTGVTKGNGSSVPFLALAIPSLALIGGLAVACFVKVFGIIFLGQPRSQATGTITESPPSMLLPMGFLAALCAIIGLAPLVVAPLLSSTVSSLFQPAGMPVSSLTQVAPLGWITVLGVILLAFTILFFVLFRTADTTPAPTRPTWGCGYLGATPRMQYTAASFADMLVILFKGILRPKENNPDLKALFPTSGTFSDKVPETVLDLIIMPFFTKANESLSLIRKLQHGKLPLYILYMLATLIALLIWAYSSA